jgi:ribulose 1,5-bisphosphate carboxylase large subunit-like protein
MAEAPVSVMPESIDDRDYVIATYLYRASSGTDIHRAAGALAEMQSTGTSSSSSTSTFPRRSRRPFKGPKFGLEGIRGLSASLIGRS